MALKFLEGYTPSDLGLDPEIFPQYRTNPITGAEVQLEAIEFAAYSEKRFVGMCLPTGIGKGLTGISIHKLTGKRTCVLTADRGLQDQYVEKHKRDGLFDIRGKQNYECDQSNARHYMTCHDGAVAGCRKLGVGCTYEWVRGVAREQELISTNYAYWITNNELGMPGGMLQRLREEDIEEYGANPVELLIMDEGDKAAEALSRYLQVRVYEKEV